MSRCDILTCILVLSSGLYSLSARAAGEDRTPASIPVHRGPGPAGLREFSPDRPGSTNSPTTIDVGHFQIEVELGNYSSFTHEEVSEKQFNFPSLVVRFGITDSSEIVVGWLSGATRTVQTAGAPDEKTSGIGDVTLGYKKNFLGNDGGPISWALGVSLKIPTNTHDLGNDAFEPTVTLPLAFDLFEGWGLSLMPEVDFRKNASGSGFHTEFNTPFTLGHSIWEGFDGFVEVVTHSSSDPESPLTAYFGMGFGAQVRPDVQFDLSWNVGLNSQTPQTVILCGWTVRY